MKEIKPTKSQVFDTLRLAGCIWCGGDGSCSCYSRQLKGCYEETEKALTHTEYTEEEEQQLRREAEKAQEALNKAISSFFEYMEN